MDEFKSLYPKLVDDPDLHLMAMLDQNLDNKISKDELRRLFDPKETGKLNIDLLTARLNEVTKHLV